MELTWNSLSLSHASSLSRHVLYGTNLLRTIPNTLMVSNRRCIEAWDIDGWDLSKCGLWWEWKQRMSSCVNHVGEFVVTWWGEKGSRSSRQPRLTCVGFLGLFSFLRFLAGPTDGRFTFPVQVLLFVTFRSQSLEIFVSTRENMSNYTQSNWLPGLRT